MLGEKNRGRGGDVRDGELEEGPSKDGSSKFCFKRYPTLEAVEGKGQVTTDTTFGKALQDFASQPDVLKVLEIGTWYGGRSTKNLVEGLKPFTISCFCHL